MSADRENLTFSISSRRIYAPYLVPFWSQVPMHILYIDMLLWCTLIASYISYDPKKCTRETIVHFDE